ncbi:MAG: methyl-accepting chemotaxis protein [Moorellales bacterium]
MGWFSRLLGRGERAGPATRAAREERGRNAGVLLPDPGPVPADAADKSRQQALVADLFSRMAEVVATAQTAVEDVDREARSATEAIFSSMEVVLNEAVTRMRQLEGTLVGCLSLESETSLVARVLTEGERSGRNLQEGLAGLGAALRRISSEYRELVDRLGTERLAALAQEIQAVARHTALLSLNASIEAARVREHGRGFSVIAAEIRQLVEKTGHAARAVARLSEEMRSELLGYASALEAEAKGADTAMAEAERLRQESATALLETAQRIDALAGALRAGLSELEKAVNGVLQTLQFQDIVGQKLTAAAGLLGSIRAVLAELSAADLPAVSEEALRGYVARVREAVTPHSLSLLRPQALRTGRVGKVYAEFGDNVELF